MNVQLLLLLALAGPFCAFTHAIPTGATTTDVYATEQSSEPSVPTTHAMPEETTGVGHTLFTGPPATAPATAEVVTVVTSAVPAVTEKEDEETQSTVPAATVAPHPRFTDPPAVETAAPTHPATAEDKTETTGAAETDMGDEVVVEDGLSSGQVVGIVIGALLAVVIVIAVVIAVVRRMGKYSP